MLSFFKKHAWWILPLLIADLIFFRWMWLAMSKDEPEAPPAVLPVQAEVPAPPPVHRLVYGYPTDQRDLADTNSLSVYQATASGRVQSALYGSVRTGMSRGRAYPSFHEGLDIAALERDRRGLPLDDVYAVTDGRVGYVNRIGGNSNYGVYVVLTHEDEVGEIYTLYAHLARAASELKPGDFVERGTVLGRMGHSASTGIPVHRAHLHFEIGTILNRKFQTWYRAQKLKPDHGKYHGHNLIGIDPLSLYGGGDAMPEFSMAEYLAQTPAAFTVLFERNRPLDYFERYPLLWQDAPYVSGVIAMDVSEGGVPMRARLATPEEVELLNGDSARVSEVDEEVLGRNGARLIRQQSGQWSLTSNGKRWLEILLY